MSDLISIKVKKHTETNTKLILLTILQEKLIYDMPKLQDLYNSIKDSVEANKGAALIIDCRRIKSVDTKIAWEGASILVKLDPITKRNLLRNCMVMENSLLENLVNLILKVHPPVIPFKIVKNNQEALQFSIQK